jgi:hypothetical protein
VGNDVEDSAKEVCRIGSVYSAHPPVVRVSSRAQAELQAGEALVFDWIKAQRSPAYVPLRTGDGPSVFAHRRAYPILVGRDIEVDCRRRLGIRSFSSSLPPDLGLRTSFGRESGGDRRERSTSGADAPPN